MPDSRPSCQATQTVVAATLLMVNANMPADSDGGAATISVSPPHLLLHPRALGNARCIPNGTHLRVRCSTRRTRADKMPARILMAIVFLMGSCHIAVAQSDTQQKIDALQAQLDQLRATTATTGTQPIWYQSPGVADGFSGIPQVPSTFSLPPQTPALQAVAPPKAAAIATSPEKEKTYPDFKLTGFFQLDSAYFGQSNESVATLGDIQDGAGFRRARLAATGNVTARGSYMMEFDMAQAQARFVDVWGQFSDTPLGNIRIGRFRQPFGMSELTGIREIALLERPTPFALSPFRQTGIMFSNNAFGDSMTWAVSGFRTISDNFGNVYGDDGGYGTAERLTFLPIDRGDHFVVHWGLDHSYLDPARGQLQIASQDEIFIGQQPNLGPGGLSVLPIITVPPFINSGVFNVDHAHLFNVESAVSLGRALLQSEYRWSNLSLPTGEDASVHGGYITARWVLTGETIPYNRAAGVFGRVKPDCPLDVRQGQWGAWEVAARYSSTNLNPLFGLPGVTGPTRRLNSFDLGLNWYMWNNAKSQLNWVNGSLNDPVLGDSVTNTIAARLQFDF